MPLYRIDAEQTTTTVFYIEAPDPMLALGLILSANDPEPDVSQTIVHAIRTAVTETDDETIVLQGAEGPVIVSAGYYDALKAQEKAETSFRAGMEWPYVAAPIEWERPEIDPDGDRNTLFDVDDMK